MKKIEILDCTLRDGGYINNWNFGSKNIEKIVDSLNSSNVNITELGFLTNQVKLDIDSTKFPNLNSMDNLIKKTNNHMFVCMINFGEYNIKDISNSTTTKIDGIRVAFHKKDMIDSINYCSELINKGFKVFVQPMVAASYSDNEYLELIKLTNKINPYAFYIVDSFGVMKQHDVIRYFYMVDYNLNEGINLGFHSHNNLQLSSSNSQALLSIHSKRNLIFDSSIHGMGRGAGNLNTELFMDYLNDFFSGNYNVEPLLEAIDYVIKPIYNKRPWGYSLPYYLSAYNNCHPNYATYLEDLSTLTVKDIGKLLALIEPDKKVNFEKDYIINLYKKYQENNKTFRSANNADLVKSLVGQKVLLIAPGKTSEIEKNLILQFIKENQVKVIGINYEPDNIPLDYVFYSNKRRYDQKKPLQNEQVIMTSNISDNNENNIHIDYETLLNDTPYVEDNAGLMIIKLLTNIDIHTLYLAGFDGYNVHNNLEDNFASKELNTNQSLERLENINIGMQKVIKEYAQKISIEFVTKQINIKL